ncbi:hypothetical protein FTV88_2331 [Heliorestis convoluta]|uniref:Uncharacterized protein n=1 Tax=Heliorestis convoluta TaxID=356322 RepID=A0A5Q2N3I6_9FIRM|nr:hypothetical protein FTV88_2331 [Heliorestis convoluta]
MGPVQSGGKRDDQAPAQSNPNVIRKRKSDLFAPLCIGRGERVAFFIGTKKVVESGKKNDLT